jgi:hypothetical protein
MSEAVACAIVVGARNEIQCAGHRMKLTLGDRSYLTLLVHLLDEFVLSNVEFICRNHFNRYLKFKLKRCVATSCNNPTNSMSLRKCPKHLLIYLNLDESAFVNVHQQCYQRLVAQTGSISNLNSSSHCHIDINMNYNRPPLVEITNRAQEIDAHKFLSAKQAQTPVNSPLSVVGKRGRAKTLFSVPSPEVGYRDASPPSKSQRQSLANAIIKQLATSSTCSDVENKENHSQFLTDLIQANTENFDVNTVTVLSTEKSVKLTEEQAIKLRTKLNLTWRQQRVLASYLNSAGCNVLPSEKSIRKAQSNYEQEFEANSLVINNETITYVRAANVQTMLDQHLADLKQAGELTTHNGLIPEGEIWVNLLGDKGGHSTKLIASILNHTKPLSRNQLLLALYEGASEDYDVVKTIFGPIFDQLHRWANNNNNDNMQENKYNDNNNDNNYYNNNAIIKLFYGGDMKWMWMLLGVSQNGRHGCVYCLSNDDKVVGKPRTYQHHMEQLELLRQTGGTTKAKSYYNCINEPIINSIAFTSTSPMPLHTFLGMGQLCLDIARDICMDLDKDLVKLKLIAANIPTTDEFERLWHINQQIQNEIEAIEQQLVVFYTAIHEDVDNSGLEDGEDSIAKQATALETAKLQLQQDLSDNILEINSIQGYFLRRFNIFLLNIKVVRKGNFGHSLVGSEVHSLFKEKSRIELANTIRSQTIVTMNNQATVLGNNAAADNLELLMQHFSTLYELCTAARKLSKKEIKTIDTTAEKLMAHYKTAYPTRSVTPKLHNLIYHFPDLAKQYRTIGLFSEHSVESVHKRFKHYDMVYCSIKNPIAHLLYSTRLHTLTADPRLNCQIR